LTEVDGFMPRTARASVGDLCYHVINRGNAQSEVFHKAGDYQVFVELISLACERIPMRVLAYCVMPNHVLCGAPHKTCYVKFRIM